MAEGSLVHDSPTHSTPPPKRRKMAQSGPPRASDLLAAFGAKNTPTSVSRMHRNSLADRGLRQKTDVDYAESAPSSEQNSPGSASSFGDKVDSSRTSTAPNGGDDSENESGKDDSDHSVDELQSEDNIVVQPRRSSTRELPQRASRAQVSYARPKRVVKKGNSQSKKKSNKLLQSDTGLPAPKRDSKPAPDTARAKVRQEILEKTKPKRDAFVLAHKESFQPLLPETSYIDKLERWNAMSDENQLPEITIYRSLEQQPQGVRAEMKPYQLEGLSFLVHMYNNGMSSILGDEMGLGKTLQTLSLFQYLAENEPTTGEVRPHLVVCPLSVLSSWISEARKWVPELNVVRFHGPKAEREKFKKEMLATQTAKKRMSTDAPVDIVVTTYDTFVSEQGWMKRAFAWRYVCLDEGHKIKNESSQMASALQSLQAEYRLLLTGTPLQNNLKEMWALLHWLYPEVFTPDTAGRFKEAFDLTNGKVSTSFMDDARHLLELIMLRRLKSSPGVNLGLPPKSEILLYVPLTPMQRFWYTRLLTKTDNATLDDLFRGAKEETLAEDEAQRREIQALERRAAIADGTKQSTGADGDGDVWAESREIMQQALENKNEEDVKKGSWQKLLNLVMQLRMVCSHPYFVKGAEPDPYYLGEHIRTASGKFIVLDKLIDELVLKQQKKIIIFSQFTKTLNYVEDLMALKGGNTYDASFRYSRLDGSTARARRNLGIRMFNDPKSEFKVMLISTRAGGLGINLASATNVIFMDEDWNPQMTIQAEARAHRIGQTQPVTVYKICTQGTVEEQMMGRIRKKLYLSTKITESMRNIHTAADTGAGNKRKHSEMANSAEADEPQLGTNALKLLLRKGAQTLVKPEVHVTAMLGWSFQEMIEKCREDSGSQQAVVQGNDTATEPDEQSWLNSMEKVETAVFEGKRHQKKVDQAMKEEAEYNRADRRVGKNTTVNVNGFEISKASMGCADWEAVATFAGKDPRLAEPVREKKAKIDHQEYCQHCMDGGEILLCSGCPRAYHTQCLAKELRPKPRGPSNWYCPQHLCVDCGSKTTEAGGMIYRCRWCENGYCEDCLDFETAQLVGPTLPELEMLGFGAVDQAWFIDCPACVEHWRSDPEDADTIAREKKRIDEAYAEFVAKMEDAA
ncbi:hypothetical protein NU219Hw_g5104t1 [Hortaea werneckii]